MPYYLDGLRPSSQSTVSGADRHSCSVVGTGVGEITVGGSVGGVFGGVDATSLASQRVGRSFLLLALR